MKVSLYFSENFTCMVKTSIKIPLALYFIFATVVIAYFFPKEGKFRYQFNEGKPWRYGLLTATSDFPIYKSEAEVNAERDSVLKKFIPYYLLQGNVEKDQLIEFEDEQKDKLSDTQLVPYIKYIRESLKKVYAKGIVSNKAMQEAQTSRNEIMLVKDNIASPESIQNHFTPKTAYEYIIDNSPSTLNKQTLQSFNLDKYILENISFDPKMSDKVKQELLQSVSPASGMVQAGERIVDRGQIIDSHTFRVLNSLKSVEEQRAGSKQRDRLMFLGQLSIVIGLMLCFGFYLYLFRPNYFYNKRNLGFLLLTMVVSCLLTGLTVSYNLFNVYIIPYAIVPIVVRIFFDSRTSIFTHTVAMLICSIMVPFSYEFLVLQLVTGMVVIFSLKELSQRSHLIRCTFFIFITYIIVYTSLVLYQDADIAKINWKMFLYFGINFVLLMFSYLLVYILEKSFGFISNISLVELSNINNPILRKLSENAPGTFQHSLHVSILASEAAAKVGANAQLVRTGALYHDIGKMENPTFFTENQINKINPHNNLSYEQSAQIIINHVHDGVKMAQKAGIPQQVIDFIQTHHGKSKTRYFYNSFRNEFPDKEINEELFTYPGPNPFSKETAILMMADAVEASSRSLSEYTEESIQNLVNRIIDMQIAEGLLNDTPLTYRDVQDIKNVFSEKLKTMYHTRISYPELKQR